MFNKPINPGRTIQTVMLLARAIMDSTEESWLAATNAVSRIFVQAAISKDRRSPATQLTRSCDRWMIRESTILFL